MDEIDRAGLRRSIPDERSGLVDFSSNDYLGLARSPDVRAALARPACVGSAGSRLLSGAHPEHAALERELAAFTGREAALLFSSGYLAALGAVHGIAHVVATAYSDELNHACLIDALRLSSLRREVVAHGTFSLRARVEPAVYVTESVYGMTGERVDLAALLARLGEDDVLLVDEAHALGIEGPRGAGLAAPLHDERVVVLGTLSKAFGCGGGFVAGPRAFIDLLVSTARSFIFDTSLPPPIAAAARVALRRIEAGDDLRAALAERVTLLERLLLAGGSIERARGATIVPIPLGDAHRALAVAAALRRDGFFAPAIRPPTVPHGAACLRLSLRADHALADVERLCASLHAALGA